MSTLATDYVRDGGAIYKQSFAIIRSEANLGRFSGIEERVAVRIIHSCGMTDIADAIRFSPGAAERGAQALADGAPILCDSAMVAHGITRARLPRGNDVICTLNDAATPILAREHGTTRSAAALELWRDRLAGSVVAIGNAPTALFHLLEMVGEGAPAPALVIGMPVGFVGAAESKELVAGHGTLAFITVDGRRGGSAMAVAAVNALASASE